MFIIQFCLPVWADVIVKPEDIEEQVKNHILKSITLDDPEATLHVDVIKLPLEQIVLKGDNLKILFAESTTAPLSYRTIVQISLSTDSEVRYIGVPVRLSLEKPVWVAKRLIRAREPISDKDVMLQRKRMEYEAAYSLGSDEKITSYTSRVNIPPGSILDIRKLSLTPAVYRNDEVHLILSMGQGINIKIFGKALEDGAIGERIRVKQSLSNNKSKIYTAEVINRNTVMVKM